MPSTIVLGASDHVLSAFFTLTTASVACGFSVSLVISAGVLSSDVNISLRPVTGLSNALLCLTVTFPVGSKPLLSANSFAANVTLPLLSAVFGENCLPLIVKVTCAFGRAFVTVIPLFDKPPVFVT